jgi:hypothetical protein
VDAKAGTVNWPLGYQSVPPLPRAGTTPDDGPGALSPRRGRLFRGSGLTGGLPGVAAGHHTEEAAQLGAAALFGADQKGQIDLAMLSTVLMTSLMTRTTP